MNLKKKHIIFIIAGMVSISACDKQADVFIQGKDVKDEKAESTGNDLVFPQTYTQNEDNVKYNLTLEMPENLDANNVPEVEVRSILYNDNKAAVELIGKNRNISDTQIHPADDYVPDEYSYFFEDGSLLTVGGSIMSYNTSESDHYTRIFRRISENPAVMENEPSDFAFASSADCLTELGDLLKMVGYDVTLSASVFPLTADQAKDWEEHLTMDGDIQESAYKGVWSEEDNAYIISAYQTYNDLPVFNERLAMNQSMAVYSPYNAPIQVIRTTRGWESLMVTAQYEFYETDKVVSLLPFETITNTVNTKFNSILSESPYEVYKAKLFLMVRHVTAQDYEAFPAWYFEAKEEGSDEKLVILVNAVTGKEIYING